MADFSASMGLGAGGKMKQEIYPDEYGIDTWNRDSSGRAFVHIANSMLWRDITGEEPLALQSAPSLYTEYGFPWLGSMTRARGGGGRDARTRSGGPQRRGEWLTRLRLDDRAIARKVFHLP
jgi:hypothetical protein